MLAEGGIRLIRRLRGLHACMRRRRRGLMLAEVAVRLVCRLLLLLLLLLLGGHQVCWLRHGLGLQAGRHQGGGLRVRVVLRLPGRRRHHRILLLPLTRLLLPAMRSWPKGAQRMLRGVPGRLLLRSILQPLLIQGAAAVCGGHRMQHLCALPFLLRVPWHGRSYACSAGPRHRLIRGHSRLAGRSLNELQLLRRLLRGLHALRRTWVMLPRRCRQCSLCMRMRGCWLQRDRPLRALQAWRVRLCMRGTHCGKGRVTRSSLLLPLLLPERALRHICSSVAEGPGTEGCKPRWCVPCSMRSRLAVSHGLCRCLRASLLGRFSNWRPCVPRCLMPHMRWALLHPRLPQGLYRVGVEPMRPC